MDVPRRKSASAATAALGFATYFAPDHTIAIALGTVVVLTVVTLTGMQRSNAVNAIIVSAVLLSLLAYLAIGFPSLQNKNEFLSPIFDSTRKSAFLEATALMFVAYTGYGRIATLGEEVREPRRTIPLAIIVTLVLTALLYLGVCAVSLAHAEGQGFGSLSLLAKKIGGAKLGMILALGAALALLSVLLNLLLGLSRVALAMGRRGDFQTSRTSEGINQSTRRRNRPGRSDNQRIGLRGGLEAHLELQRVHGACLLRRDQPVRHQLEPGRTPLSRVDFIPRLALLPITCLLRGTTGTRDRFGPDRNWPLLESPCLKEKKVPQKRVKNTQIRDSVLSRSKVLHLL